MACSLCLPGRMGLDLGLRLQDSPAARPRPILPNRASPKLLCILPQASCPRCCAVSSHRLPKRRWPASQCVTRIRLVCQVYVDLLSTISFDMPGVSDTILQAGCGLLIFHCPSLTGQPLHSMRLGQSAVSLLTKQRAVAVLQGRIALVGCALPPAQAATLDPEMWWDDKEPAPATQLQVGIRPSTFNHPIWVHT